MNFVIISPFPPYRGGISKETEVLYNNLIYHEHKVKIINFKILGNKRRVEGFDQIRARTHLP